MATPEYFDASRSVGDSGWTILGTHYPTHPRLTVTAEDWAVFELFTRYQGGGFGGGFLPEAGGVLDQPAKLLDAFSICEAAQQQWREAHPPRRRR